MKKPAVIIVLLLLLAVSGIYCYHFFGGYEGLSDGNDYAGLARSIVRGEGFNLGHVYPLALAFNTKIPQPDNMWAPGYPLYLAIWFSLFGVSDKIAILASIFALWFLIFASYLLGRRVIGDKIALAVAGLVALSQIILLSAVEGTPEILSGALLVFSIFIILRKQNISHILLSALLFGLMILTRYQMAIIGVPFAIFLIENKKRNLPLWAGMVILVTVPWMIRNLLVLGGPFFTLQSYGEFTKGMGRFDDYYYTYRSFTPMTLLYALSHFPLAVAKKFVAGLVFFGRGFPGLLNFLGIIPFFFALLRIERLEGIQKRIIIFAFASAVIVIFISSFDGHHERHLIPLLPYFAITVMIGFIFLAKEFGIFGRKTLVLIIGALLFIPAKAPFQEWKLSRIAGESRANQKVYSQIAAIVKPDEVVLSDASDAIWWYTDRPSIWTPVHYNDIKTLFGRADCRYIYLAKPIEFINKLRDDQIVDFTMSTELMPGLEGQGRLYRIKKGNELQLDEAM